jgi:hypothetical protein
VQHVQAWLVVLQADLVAVSREYCSTAAACKDALEADRARLMLLQQRLLLLQQCQAEARAMATNMLGALRSTQSELADMLESSAQAEEREAEELVRSCVACFTGTRVLVCWYKSTNTDT